MPPIVTTVLSVLGGAYVVVSALALVVPKTTKCGALLARIALDLKPFEPKVGP